MRPPNIGALRGDDGRQRGHSAACSPVADVPLSPAAREARQRQEAAWRQAETPEVRERRLAKMRKWAADHRPPPTVRVDAPQPDAPPARPSNARMDLAARAAEQGVPPSTIAWQLQEDGVRRVIARAIAERTLHPGSPYWGWSLARFDREYQSATDTRHAWRQPGAGGEP